MNSLGLLFKNGQGVPQDYTKAREWYEKAVAKDNSCHSACNFDPLSWGIGVQN
jgi:uncharacterized protein